MPQYWVVGAMWGGRDDQYDLFLRRRYWYLGWDDEDKPIQTKRRDRIRPGDRIAIKRMLGKSSKDIEIRAIGIVRKIARRSSRVYVYVNWVQPDINRRVASKGCFASIHGPFPPADRWTKKVFGEDMSQPSVMFPDEIAALESYIEGASLNVDVNAHERNPRARKVCIRHYGTSCSVCGFNFGVAYGKYGQGFIHVHHIKPLSEIDKEYTVDPILHLRPVCPNCHAMLHRSDPPLATDALKAIYEESTNNRRRTKR